MKRTTAIKILLIEDDPAIVTLIDESLRRSKRNVISFIHAHTMHEAFRVLAKKRVDLILVDTVLPDGSGVENFDAIQSVAENIPFIVLCRDEDHALVKEALNHGAQDCVSTDSSSIARILPRAILYALDRSESILEQKLLSREVALSEKKYRDVVENAVEIIYTTDEKGNFTFANRRALAETGFTLKELCTHNYLDLVLPEFRRRLATHYIRQYARRTPTTYVEFPHRIRTGEIKWWAQNATLMMEDEKFTGFLVVARDITDRKKMEEALEDSEKRYRELFLSNPHPMWVYDLESLCFLEVNDAAVHHYGYSKSEFLNMKITDIRPQEDIPALMENVQRVDHGIDAAGIWRHRKKSGDIIDVEITSHTLLFRGKNAELVLSNDVTEQRKAHHKIQSSEEKHRNIFDWAPVGIYQSDRDGRFLIANISLAKILGYDSIDELMQKNTAKDIYFNAMEREALITKYEPKGHASNMELKWKKKDGSPIWIQLTAHAVKDSTGKTKYFEGFVADITEQKNAEVGLRENEAKYRQLFEAESDALLFVDNEDGRIIEANAAASAMYGYTHDEIVALRNTDISAEPEETKRVTQKSPVNINEIISVPLRYHRKKDGTVFPVEITGRFFNHYGRAVHIAAVRDISERVAAEESRKQSQERYQSFVSQSSEGIWRFELEIPIAVTAPIDEQIEHYFLYGYLAECNDAMAKMYGYERSSEIIGARLGDLLRKEDPNNLTFLRNFITNGYKLWDGESCEYDKANNQKYFRNSLTGIIQDGKLVRAWGLQQDITEQKRVNDALRESEARYRTLIETSRDGISLTDMSGNILYANKQKASMLGYERSEQLIGESAMRLLVSDAHGDIAALMNHLRTHEYITNVEFTVQRKDGSTFPAEFSASIIKDDQGNPIAIMDVMRDITERKFAEQALRHSEEQYRGLIEQSPDPIYIVQDDIVILFNSAWLKLFEYTAEELRNEKFPIMNTVAPESLTYIEERRRLRRAGEVVDQIFEFTGMTKSGKRINLEANIIDIVWKGKPARQGIFRDITKHKQIQNELRIALVDAQKADRLKDAFIANISHEIRTPINIILGYSNIIKDVFTERATEQEKKFFESVGRASKRLLRTVDEILNIASLQTNSYLAHPERFNVHASLEKLAREMQLISSEKYLPIRFTSDCPGLMVYLDIYSFEQAVTNLLDNAIKYTQSGSIDLILKNSKHTFSVLVRDTGIGISEDYLPHLFDQFSQEVIGYTRPYEGVGLGMALTKKYTEMNHGTIEVSSKKGEGTTFTLTFAIDERLQSGGVDDSNIIFVTKSPNLKLQTARGRVLVVEDDRQNQEFMELLLAKYFDLSIVESAEEAWQILHSNRIDLILMDIALRGDENGIQFTRRIRATEQFVKIPIIAVTAFAFPDDRENSLQAGCNEYLSKPFTKKQFYSVLHNFILFDE